MHRNLLLLFAAFAGSFFTQTALAQCQTRTSMQLLRVGAKHRGYRERDHRRLFRQQLRRRNLGQLPERPSSTDGLGYQQQIYPIRGSEKLSGPRPAAAPTQRQASAMRLCMVVGAISRNWLAS